MNDRFEAVQLHRQTAGTMRKAAFERVGAPTPFLSGTTVNTELCTRRLSRNS